MNARTLMTAAALLSASGCFAPYVNSTRDDAAILTVVPATRTALVVHAFANGSECRTHLNVAGSGKLTQPAAIHVPPNETFTLDAFLSDPAHSCRIVVSFLPRPREAYMAVIEGSSLRCRMEIQRANGQQWLPEASARKRSWKSAIISDDEAQCD